MHPDRGILHTYRRSDGLSTRPDNHNTFTRQSADTNEFPRDPLHGPVTWNPARTRPYSTLRLRLRLHLQSITIATSSALLRQEPTHCCIRYTTLAQSSASAVLCWQMFPTGFDSPVFDLIRLTCFPTGLNSPVFDWVGLTCFSIGFDSPVFDLTRLTCF